MNSLERARGTLATFLTGSLGRRLGLNLFVYSLVGLAAILLLLGTVIDHRFARLEQKEIDGHIERTKAMLDGFEQTALTRALDWAVWDESYDYLAAPSADYESGNLNFSSMQNIEISGMSLVRFDGSFRKTIYFDIGSGKTDAGSATAFEQAITTPAFANIMRYAKTKTGFVRVNDRTLVIAAAQIFRSDESGSPQGYLVMGKELKDADIAEALQLPAHIGVDGPKQLPQVTRTADRVLIFEPIEKIGGGTAAAIHFAVPRSLHQEGAHLLWMTMGGVGLLLTVMIVLLNWRLRAVLIRPVAAFQSHVSRITSSGDLAHFEENRRDELGALYREFNLMTDELETLRSKVEAQSFAIGKSDTATDIMHNVRNAISPVHAILGKLDQRLQFPAEANVKRALDELENDQTSPDRRAKLLAFVKAAIAKLEIDLSQHRSDVHEALRSVGHVDEAIIRAQSNGSATEDAPVDCELSPIIGTSSAIARHSSAANVTVDFTADERFRVALPRVLLAQIIDNILTNAVEAIGATGRGHGEILIQAVRADQPSTEFVRLVIRDDGDGFVPDDVSSFFERGHSGRHKASGGIGLHWCANTLNACGGSIRLSSEGIGAGSTVEMLLPLASTARATEDRPSVADAA